MSRALRAVLAAAALLATLTAADCDRKGSVHSDRPATERRADPKRERVVAIRADSDGPYNIVVRAGEIGQALGDYSREPIPGGEYTQTLTYTSGQTIEIRVHVRGNRADRFTCSIDDGPGNAHTSWGYGEVFCALVTLR